MNVLEVLLENKYIIGILIIVIVIIALLIEFSPKNGNSSINISSNNSSNSSSNKDKITDSLILLANSLDSSKYQVSSNIEVNDVTPGVGNPSPSPTRRLTTEELSQRSRIIITKWWISFLSVVPNDMRYLLANCNSVTDMYILQNTIICLVSNLSKKYSNTNRDLTENDILKIYKNKEQCDVLGAIIFNFLLSQIITRGFESEFKNDNKIILFKIRDVDISEPNYYDIPYSIVLELYKNENMIKIYGSLKDESQRILDELKQNESASMIEFKNIFQNMNMEEKIDISLFAKFVIFIWTVKFPELDDNCSYCIIPNNSFT